MSQVRPFGPPLSTRRAEILARAHDARVTAAALREECARLRALIAAASGRTAERVPDVRIANAED